MEKYKVESWKWEKPKLSSEEFITAILAFKALLLFMFVFLFPLGLFFIIINFIGDYN